ncbi:MAG: response regulator [Chitinispirillaceae bacterium]|nr:response regulator [Chitinispirillaceae bacterium]
MSPLPKILIVDDDHDTLDLLELFLYKNYDIVTAMNGFEALSRIEVEKPHLIMTDIKMPVMDGIRFFNSLRRQSSRMTVPVIAITSFSQEHTIKSLTSMGFAGVMVKPPQRAAVLSMVTKMVPSPLQIKQHTVGGKQTK